MPCVVNNEDIDWLINLGWVDIAESENRKEIAAGLVAAVRSARKVSGTRGQTSGGEHGF